MQGAHKIRNHGAAGSRRECKDGIVTASLQPSIGCKIVVAPKGWPSAFFAWCCFSVLLVGPVLGACGRASGLHGEVSRKYLITNTKAWDAHHRTTAESKIPPFPQVPQDFLTSRCCSRGYGRCLCSGRGLLLWGIKRAVSFCGCQVLA